MKKTFFTGQREIPGGFEDPNALWAFDPVSLNFEQIFENRTTSVDNFGFVGDDLYFILSYPVGTDFRDGGSTMARLDPEDGSQSFLFPDNIPRQSVSDTLFLEDGILFNYWRPPLDSAGELVEHPENGIYYYDTTEDELTQLSILNYDETDPEDGYYDVLLEFGGTYSFPFLDGAIFGATTGFVFDLDSVWFTDGTEAGTYRLTGDTQILQTSQIYRDDSSQPWIQLNSPTGPIALFAAETEEHGWEIWSTNGTAEGTQVIDLAPGPDSGLSAMNLAPFGDQAVFVGGTRETGYELFITDGTPDGTRLLYEDIPGPGARSGNLANFGDSRVFDDTLLFSWGDTFWQTDGTTEGTRQFYSDSELEAIGAEFALNNPSYGESYSNIELGIGLNPGGFFDALEVGDQVFFMDLIGLPFDNSWHLFVTDGTTSGTTRLSPGLAFSGGGDGQSTLLSAYGDHVLFMMSYGDADRFYATNGTVEGTFELSLGLPEGVTFSADDRNDAGLKFWEPDTLLVFDDAPVSSGNDGIRMTSEGSLDAGAGDDRIEGSSGNDTIAGGAGADTLDGGAGTDTAVFGFAHGDAVIEIDGDRVRISQGGETDELVNFEIFEFTNTTRTLENLLAPSVPVILTGTEEEERLQGEDEDDRLSGAGGNDTLIGNAGNDSLDGGLGADTLNGGDGNDTLLGGPAEDDLRDVVYAGAGDDSVDAGAGNDLVFGQDGNDTIAGGAGVDELQGQDGDDVITGSNFSDLVFGGAGNDFVNGGFGSDRINGGTGADKFFHAGVLGHGSDWVQDYVAADGDVLLWGGGPATADDFQVNFAHTANDAGERSGDDTVQEGFVIYKPTEQIIWALVDGESQSSINLQIGGDTFDLLG